MKTKFKCDICKYYDAYSSLCETCFENEHFEEDKYRWHDLRKDPNDLPKKFNQILAITSNGNCIVNRPLFSNVGLVWVLTGYVAWKYIEPFDEVEE